MSDVQKMKDLEESVELFDALLGADIESIEDLPDFVQPPSGDYRLLFESAEKGVSKDKTKGQIRGTFIVAETIELQKPEEDASVPEGSKFSQMWTGKLGIQLMKKLFEPSFEQLGVRNLADFIEQAQGMEFICTVSNRQDPEKVDELGNPLKYASIKAAILA